MKKLTAQEKGWISQLGSNNPAYVMMAIREIRHHGNIRMLPFLFQLLQPSTHSAIRESVLMLIGEIKIQDAVPLIIEMLEKAERGGDFARLVSACWQSGLDFSNYIPLFIDIFVEGDYQTAVEAFSVIEESVMNADEKIQKQCLKILQESKDKVSAEKHPLYMELVKVVSGQ